MTARISCMKLGNIGKNITYLRPYWHSVSTFAINHYHSYRYFGKKVAINKTDVMKEWRSKYDRSDVQKDYKVDIPFEKLDISCCRSSGPGGQNVNKVATKVEVRIDLNDSDWIPEEVIQRLQERQKGRINKNNEFILVSDTHRTQYDNKNEANKRLKEIFEECCYPERERIESSMPKEYKELEKEYNIKQRTSKSQKKEIKNRGW